MLAEVSCSETDSGPKRLAPGAERFCAATRTVRPVSELIRFVVGPDGDVVPDLKRKLPGRGVWITATRAAVAEAARRKVFARGFRRDVRVPTDLAELVGKRLERFALDALSVAHKAGLVAPGFAKAEAALADQTAVALVHASDAAPDGLRKLDGAARRRFGNACPTIGAFTSAELDLALGRSNVIHAALLAGSASETFLARCRNLERFRTVEPSGPG